MEPIKKPSKYTDDFPPVFKNWRSWYLLVLGFLGLQIIIYYLITLATA